MKLGERKNLFGCVWEATRVYKANNKGLYYKNRVEMTVVEVLNNDFYKVGDKMSFGVK